MFASFSGSNASGFGGSIVCDTPGKHTLDATIEVSVYDGRFLDRGGSRRLHQRRRSLSATFEVLETAPSNFVTLIDEPSREGSLRACIEPVRVTCFRRKGRPLNCQVQIKIEAPPVNIAFDVIMRVDGTEHDLDSIHEGQGESAYRVVSGAYDGPAPETCDIILRSNVDILRRTVDLYSAWEGELVYANLPIETVVPRTEPAE